MEQYRNAQVEAIAEQLLRGPSRLRLRQLRGIEFLCSVIEPDKKYPLDFVVHALTGFRPAAGSDERALLAGSSLREDLVLLAEQLSGAADILAEELAERVSSVADLAQRFDVSTKTIFRWHRRGLIGWRLRFNDRRTRLAFPERCVLQFVSANAALVARGSSFSQLSEDERQTIVRRAEEIVGLQRCTVNAVARTIATETGRAVETIRMILRQHDQAHPRCGLFNRAVPEESDLQRLSIWEAHLEGLGVQTLAERFGRPVPEIYAVIQSIRVRELAAREIEFMPCADFEAAGAEERILRNPCLAAPYAESCSARAPRDLPPYLQQLFRLPLLSPAGEQALFRKFNYLKFLADRRRKALDPQRGSASEIDAVERLLDEAAQVKGQLVQANLRLVVSIAKRHVSPSHDLFELISDGNVSLMRAVDRFDFTRGFKFSTYCSWAVMKNFARSLPGERVRRDRYQTGRDELLDTFASYEMDERDDELRSAMRNVIDRMFSTLDPREQAILRQRFGLDNGGAAATLDQIGQGFGVSKERIRQLESRAIAKLRSEFSDEAAGLFSA